MSVLSVLKSLFTSDKPMSLNDAVRKELKKHGDDGRAERHIIHFAYPSPEATVSQKDMMTSLAKEGYDVFEATEGGVRFEHTREVASASFDELTLGLSNKLEAVYWDYDGWECQLKR